MKFCSSWKIESETLIAVGNTTLGLSSTDEVWTKWVVVYICVNEFLDKCISTFESSVNKCIWKNCIQKCLVQISGAYRGFYSVSLHEGYSSVRTFVVRIVSRLTLFLYQRLCCRILS